jgi:paraquat-inducible protein B
MNEPHEKLPGSALPTAPAHQTHRSRVPLVWMVPAIAALIGGWLLMQSIRDHGPTVVVSFNDAEGIEAGKTKLRFENIDVGTVKLVTLGSDRHTVDVSIDTARFATPLLVASSRFWVVRPRLGASGVSGLDTLLSGAFIAMDVGDSAEAMRHFVGLENPPAVTGRDSGREFVLDAVDLGSLVVASPIYFRHIQVGQVSAVDLNGDGRGVTVKVFVRRPYDRFVTTDTRFWHASGVDVEVDSAGVHVQSESLSTILAGGIAFDEMPDVQLSHPAEAGSHFVLTRDRVTAMMPRDGAPETFVLYFDESLRGLKPGAAIDFLGVDIGTVKAIQVAYQARAGRLRLPVLVNLYPERLRTLVQNGGVALPVEPFRNLIGRMVDEGLRAQLRTASLMTGQLYVELDFFPRSAALRSHPEQTPMLLPTVPGNIEQIENSFVSLAQKLDRLPLGRIAQDLDRALVSSNRTLDSAHALLGSVQADLVPAARLTLEHTGQAFSPDGSLEADLHMTLTSIGKAADSVKVLTDYLDAHPEALILGKSKESQ